MASSTGSSRSYGPPTGEPGLRRVAGALLLGAGLLAAVGQAAVPPYLREALDQFTAEVPPGWAYTQTTVRDEESTIERFDPGVSPADQWTLQQHNNRPPDAEALAKYIKFKTASAPPLAQAPFQKSDIDPGSIELLREDGEQAEFTCSFRAESTGSDKMLGHLRLVLTVRKQPTYVEKFALELRAPYSPVLGVKMNELSVQMRFSPPGSDRPSLPAESSSLFGGRIFFVPTAENLRVTYSNFVRIAPSR